MRRKGNTMIVDIPNIERMVPQIDAHYLQQFLVASLYNAGTISAKEACDILNMSRHEFELLLCQFDLAIFPDTKVDVENELQQQ